MRNRLILPLMFFLSLVAAGQTTLSKEVMEFVRVQSPVTALEHVRIIDGTGAAARADQTILISGGKIAAMGASGSVTIPDGANRMDFTGYSAIPGMVGMHEHLFYPLVFPGKVFYRNMSVSFPRLYLAAGLTTIRTGGSMEPYTDLEVKRAVESGVAAGPKINATGPYLEGKNSRPIDLHQLDGPEDARRTVKYWAEEGSGSFKVYNFLSRAELKAIVDEAHRHHLKVTGHLCSIGFREAAEIGIDNLEHGITVDTEFLTDKKPDECPNAGLAVATAAKLSVSGPEIQATIRTLVEHHVAVTSTLPVFEQFVAARPNVPPAALAALNDATRLSYLTNRANLSLNPNSPWPAMFQREMEFERAFVQAGGLLIAGTDPTGLGGVVAGFGDQREVELLVEAGFTPIEAIKIQTLNGALFLGLQDSIGSLATGKQADIVLIKGDPSANIKDIEKVEVVFKDGIGYDSKKLIDSVKGQVGNW